LRVDRIFVNLLISSISLAITIAPVLAIPPTLQTDLTDRDLQTLERLISIAQTTSVPVKEAQAGLSFAPFNEAIVLSINKGLSGDNGDLSDDDNGQSSGLSAELSIDLIRVISTFEAMPARRAQFHNAQRQTRLAVTQAYIAYIQARQVRSIAQYRMQRFGKAKQHLANTEYVTAATELLTANSNERIALESLAAVVGRSIQEILLIESQLNQINF
jgi:outer membrane protein TolC